MNEIEAVRQDTFNKMLDHGVAIHYVGGHSERASRAYTIGRTLKGRPELLMTGPFPVDLFAEILNRACAVDDKEPLQPFEVRSGLIDGREVQAVECDPMSALMAGAIVEFGRISALQLLWPDDDGHFPTSPLYSHTSAQPVFIKD